jgi:hypothetical protein
MIYDHTLFVLLEKFEDIKGVIRSCCIHILYVKYINKIKLVFSWVRVVQSLDFCVVFCRSLFVLLYFFLFAIVPLWYLQTFLSLVVIHNKPECGKL